MSKCGYCKHYIFKPYNGDGLDDESCNIDILYLHDDDCPNYEKEL